MKISTRARYALRLMIDLADNSAGDGPVVLRDIAERQQISKRYLEQLATTLRNANLVTSVQGRGGGYALPRSPVEITVAEIIRASIGRIKIVGCVDCPDVCSRYPGCPSRRMFERVNGSINDILDSVTLADLCECGVDIASLADGHDGVTPCRRPPTLQETA